MIKISKVSNMKCKLFKILFYLQQLTLVVLTVSVVNGDNDLLHVFVISRTGDRSILKPSFPNNPYSDESNWPDGFGELTIQGKQLMFWIGQNIGQMYIGPLYTGNPNDVRAYTLNIDRCTESVQLLGAGLNPPKDRWIWNKFKLLWWQPLKITQLPDVYSTCPFVYKSEEWIKLKKKHLNDLVTISTYTGNNITLEDIYNVYDVLNCIDKTGKKLPNWANESTINMLKEIYTKSERIRISNDQCISERSSFINKIILKTLKEIEIKFASGEKHDKITLFNVHHINLMAFIRGLTQSNELNIPPYGATLFIEVYNSKPWTVKVNYIEKTENFIFKKLSISSLCPGNPCPLNQFKSILTN